MKVVKTVDLLSVENEAETPKKRASSKPDNHEQSKGNAKPKTYSLEERHIKQINSTAMSLSQKQGKVVGASEALRYMLDQVDGKIKA